MDVGPRGRALPMIRCKRCGDEPFESDPSQPECFRPSDVLAHASPVAVARIHCDFQELRHRPLADWSAGLSYAGDPFRWLATLVGPEGTPYEGGAFVFRIRFPKDYPFQPPKVKMITKIYHPNFTAGEFVCMGVFTSQWSPADSVSDVLLAISSLMEAPDMDNPLDQEVALVYKEDPELFIGTARQWTNEFAKLK